LAFGKEVVTVKVRDKDRYGRTVADVILPDGRNLNHKLVKAGYAWWFRKYAPHDRELERLEKEARDAKRGLWSDPRAIPPWEFRKQRKGESGFTGSNQNSRALSFFRSKAT
jgi:micrococcal nuclease